MFLNHCVCWIHLFFATIYIYHNVLGPISPQPEHLGKDVLFSYFMCCVVCLYRNELRVGASLDRDHN